MTLIFESSTHVVNESTLFDNDDNCLSTNVFICAMMLSWFCILPRASFHTNASRSSMLLSSQLSRAGISSISVVILRSSAPFMSIMLASRARTLVIISTFSGLLRFKLILLCESPSGGLRAPRIGGNVRFLTVSDRWTAYCGKS